MAIIMSNRHLHHATGPDLLRIRTDRLAALACDQIEAGLTWLAGHSPHIFGAVINAARTWDDGRVEDPSAPIAS
jgi:hypothetical protein